MKTNNKSFSNIAVLLLATLLIGLSPLTAAAEDAALELPKQEPTAESLEATVLYWEKGSTVDDADARAAVALSSMPSEEDAKALFPEHAGKFAMLFELMRERMEDRMKSVPPRMLQRMQKEAGEIVSVEASDVRDDDAKRFEKVLKMVPQDLPVYRVVSRTSGGGGGSSSCLFVNGRWVHFQGFESVPGMLAKLDEMFDLAAYEAVGKMHAVLQIEEFREFYRDHCHSFVKGQVDEDEFLKVMESEKGKQVVELLASVQSAIAENAGVDVLMARPGVGEGEFSFELRSAKEQAAADGVRRLKILNLAKEDGVWKLKDFD